MARRNKGPVRAERTRTSSTWVALAVAIIFLILLIIFIAQNDRKVQLHYLGASGQISEALALLAAAVAGALVVLLVGVGRIVQLRLVGRRYNRKVAQQRETDSAAAAAPGEVQPIETDK